MKEHIISLAEAETHLTAAAAYLAENIGSSDGHAEAMKEIVAYYTAQGKVDLAAELADTVKDNFVRDNLLIKISEKCAVEGDDEYAFQLAEAIEDYGLWSAAQERIAVQKAARGEFDEALNVVDELSHPDEGLAAIALQQIIDNQENEAQQSILRIEYPATKTQALQAIANYFQNENNAEKADRFLAEAVTHLNEIELPEEKIRTLLAIAGQYIEASKFDKAIEILGQARTASEVLDSTHREGFLSTGSLNFLRAGSIDLADRTLDLITDKTQIAATLAGFSAEFEQQGESEEAFESIEEAYAILKSQKDREIRDSQSRFNLLNSVAGRFAALGKVERAMEIALNIPVEEERNNALMQIAIACTNKGNDEQMRQATAAIEDENIRAISLINISDAEQKLDRNSEAMNLLNESHALVRNITRPSARANALNEIAKRFFKYGEPEKARETVGESLQAVKQILDESHRAVALLHLGEAYDFCQFDLDERERLIISTMLRKAEW